MDGVGTKAHRIRILQEDADFYARQATMAMARQDAAKKEADEACAKYREARTKLFHARREAE